jgi:putative phosphoribosyl transferase
MLFRDRAAAGRALAERLRGYAGDSRVRVLGLPRGGIPVAYEVAAALGAPLDVFIVRTLGVPGQEELAMGAIASGGVRVVNADVFSALGLTERDLERAAVVAQAELERREKAYRGERPAPDLAGAVVIVVDDGLATGATMRAAVSAIRGQGAQRIVVAVPVAAPSTRDALAREVDEIACVATPDPFLAVGRFYEDFTQTTDAEVHDLLERAARRA